MLLYVSFLQREAACSLHSYGEEPHFTGYFQFLVSNAFKYTVQGSITMGYEIRENGICFYVSDTGTGLFRKIK